MYGRNPWLVRVWFDVKSLKTTNKFNGVAEPNSKKKEKEITQKMGYSFLCFFFSFFFILLLIFIARESWYYGCMSSTFCYIFCSPVRIDAFFWREIVPRIDFFLSLRKVNSSIPFLVFYILCTHFVFHSRLLLLLPKLRNTNLYTIFF